MTNFFILQGDYQRLHSHFKNKCGKKVLPEQSGYSNSQENKYRSSFVTHADPLCYQTNAFSGAGDSIVASQQEGQGLILPFLCGVFARSPYASALLLQVLWPGIAIKKDMHIQLRGGGVYSYWWRMFFLSFSLCPSMMVATAEACHHPPQPPRFGYPIKLWRMNGKEELADGGHVPNTPCTYTDTCTATI